MERKHEIARDCIINDRKVVSSTRPEYGNSICHTK